MEVIFLLFSSETLPQNEDKSIMTFTTQHPITTPVSQHPDLYQHKLYIGIFLTSTTINVFAKKQVLASLRKPFRRSYHQVTHWIYIVDKTQEPVIVFYFNVLVWRLSTHILKFQSTGYINSVFNALIDCLYTSTHRNYIVCVLGWWQTCDIQFIFFLWLFWKIPEQRVPLMTRLRKGYHQTTGGCFRFGPARTVRAIWN